MIYIAVIALVGLSSCDFLISPLRERENPLDPSNPVAPVGDFHAKAIPDQHKVVLSWTVPETNKPAGILIVRKTGSAPTSKDDGMQIDLSTVDGLSYEDGNAIQTNTVYYYRAWTYGSGNLADQYTDSGTAKADTTVYASALNFKALATSATNVKLTWEFEQNKTFPPVCFIVRKTGTEAPANETDGLKIQVFQGYYEAADNLVAADTAYTYKFFYKDADGTLIDLPEVKDGASTTLKTLSLPAEANGYATSEPAGYFGPGVTSLFVNSNITPSSSALIKFPLGDQSSTPEYIGTVVSLHLSLYCETFMYSGKVEIYRYTASWSETSYPNDYWVANTNADTSFTPLPALYISGIGTYTVDITDLIRYIYQNDTDNGILLKPDTTTEKPTVYFSSRTTAVASQAPKLIISYYGD